MRVKKSPWGGKNAIMQQVIWSCIIGSFSMNLEYNFLSITNIMPFHLVYKFDKTSIADPGLASKCWTLSRKVNS